MISSSPLTLQPNPGSPHRWDDPRHWLRGFHRIFKRFQHDFDSSSNFWPSIKGRGKLVAKSSADRFLVAKTLMIATRATHYCLDEFCMDQDSLSPLQSIHQQAKPWLPLTPIWEFGSLRSTFPKSALLQTFRSFLKPSTSSSLFSSFSQRVSHWVFGLQMTENRYTTDALVHVRSDKYPKTSNHRGVTSNDALCIEVSTQSLQQEKSCKVVLDLSGSSQTLNSSDQRGFSCSRCSSFVRQNKEHSCINGSCTILEDENDILQVVGFNGREKTIRTYVHKFKGYVRLEYKPWAFSTKEKGFITTNRKLDSSHDEPDDNAGSINRIEDGSSRAPTDGETSKKPPKRRQSGPQSSHYDEGTNGTAKAYKKRKQDSAERDDVDSDEFGGGTGKTKNGSKRNDEEESAKRKFACPFYKYDRQAFMSSRTCVGPGWDSVHRVKEHIFRRHMLSSTQCADCLENFETSPALDEHLENPCRRKPPLGSYGINKEQEKQLRSRRMYQKSVDEEEKWRAIYKIIFPNEKNIPSPYYDPEVPEFPDVYQQMLIQELPGIVTRRLTAPELGLVEHIATNAMVNRQSSTREADRKPNGGYNLSPNQASVGPQLQQQIQNAVKDAVREMLSRVDGPKEPKPELQINVKAPDEESKGFMKKEEQAQIEKPARLQNNLLQPPGIVGTESKFDPRAQYPTPTSSAFSRSPGVSLAAMEQTLAESTFLQPAPQENALYPLFNENHSGSIVQHTTGGSSFPELESLGSHPWENLGDSSTGLTVPLYAPADLNLNPNVSGPASFQTQELLSAQDTEQENFDLGPWNFPQTAAIQPVGLGFEDWDVSDQFSEPFF